MKINPELWRRHWCEFKHLVASRELGLEITAFLAREIFAESDVKKEEHLIRMMHDVTENTKGIENLLVQLTDFTSEANASIEVSNEGYNHFLQQVGHFICAEEHMSDHLKSAVSKLKEAKEMEEKEKHAVEVNHLMALLDSLRLTRQNCINRFLSGGERQVEGVTS